MKLILIFVTVFVGSISALGQWKPWKRIEPLRSGCNTLERIFAPAKCESGIFRYSSAEFDLTAYLNGVGKTSKNSQAVVRRVMIVFHRLPLLSALESDVSKFVVKAESDNPSVTDYIDASRGISYSVQSDDGGVQFVSSLQLFPKKKSKPHR